MKFIRKDNNQRRQDRRKVVLPVRVRGKDSSGASFEELAHTLDVTPAGVRLGAIRHQLAVPEQVTLSYRQRKMEFRVIWTRQLTGLAEYHVGLQAVTQDAEAWGFNPADFPLQEINDVQAAANTATGAA